MSSIVDSLVLQSSIHHGRLESLADERRVIPPLRVPKEMPILPRDGLRT